MGKMFQKFWFCLYLGRKQILIGNIIMFLCIYVCIYILLLHDVFLPINLPPGDNCY
jgi:hypothetical protein